MDTQQALQLSAADVEKLPEPQALEVLATHVKAKKKELAEALAASKSKSLARAAKKALYQLKSSGVELAPAPVEPSPGKAAPLVAEYPALLSSVLGTGERALFFGRSLRGGGVEIFQSILHDEFGVQQLDRAETNRSSYRKHLRDIHGDSKVIEVPLARAVEELGRGWAQNLRSKNGLAPGMDENFRRLGVRVDETLLEVPAPQAEDAPLVSKGATLHEQPEIAAWLPPEAQIAAIAQQLEALRSLKAEPAALKQKVEQAADELFTGPVRQLYARRLWRMAEFFTGTDRKEAGELAGACARALFHETKGAGPFGRQLFEKVIDLSQTTARPSLRPPGL